MKCVILIIEDIISHARILQFGYESNLYFPSILLITDISDLAQTSRINPDFIWPFNRLPVYKYQHP